MQWSDFQAGFNKGGGAAGSAFRPSRSVGTSSSLTTFTSTGSSSGSSTPEGLSWAAKAHFSLAQAPLGGHCISALFVKGYGAAAVLGWLGLAVIVHSWGEGKCLSLGETFLHFSHYYRNENAVFLTQDSRSLVLMWFGFLLQDCGITVPWRSLSCCSSCCPPQLCGHLRLILFHS